VISGKEVPAGEKSEKKAERREADMKTRKKRPPGGETRDEIGANPPKKKNLFGKGKKVKLKFHALARGRGARGRA